MKLDIVTLILILISGVFVGGLGVITIQNVIRHNKIKALQKERDDLLAAHMEGMERDRFGQAPPTGA